MVPFAALLATGAIKQDASKADAEVRIFFTMVSPVLDARLSAYCGAVQNVPERRASRPEGDARTRCWLEFFPWMGGGASKPK